jgi:hypothetical protein
VLLPYVLLDAAGVFLKLESGKEGFDRCCDGLREIAGTWEAAGRAVEAVSGLAEASMATGIKEEDMGGEGFEAGGGFRNGEWELQVGGETREHIEDGCRECGEFVESVGLEPGHCLKAVDAGSGGSGFAGVDVLGLLAGVSGVGVGVGGGVGGALHEWGNSYGWG